MLFKLFENRVSAGGYFIVERAGLFDTLQRDDIKLVTVPALGMALEMGERRASNMVLLGVYIGITHSISAPFVEGEIEKRFSAKEKALSLNLNAFRKGLAEAPKLVA
jgi:2-oxoglutarate ferredoxin oxidoreductase subunit gamma